MSGPVRILVTTAPTPGAVAIIQLHGDGARDILRGVTGLDDWPAGRLRLAPLAGVDRGLAVMLRGDWAQVMPHGGPRVVRKIVEKMRELGAVYDNAPAARDVYPEAASDLEADMLATLARAASPAAIDLLLAQPRLWRAIVPSPKSPEATARERVAAYPPPGEGACEKGTGERTREMDMQGLSAHPHPDPLPGAAGTPLGEGILARSRVLDRLIDPPTVVVVGRPNVGKSTLSNRVLGRSASIVADLPGTTRDWVAGLAEIHGVAVRWLDTPGVRGTDDPIEARAIEIASRVIASAGVLIAMRDHEIDWPEPGALPREPDAWVVNKSDRGTPTESLHDAIRISAETGAGVEEMTKNILARLGLAEIHQELWAFSDRLKELVRASDVASLAAYVTGK